MYIIIVFVSVQIYFFIMFWSLCKPTVKWSGTKSYWRGDKAREPLFTYVKEEVLRRPTFSSFIALLDNYETSTGKDETVTPEEIKENQLFIDNICKTKVCSIIIGYIKAKFFLSGYESCP